MMASHRSLSSARKSPLLLPRPPQMNFGQISSSSSSSSSLGRSQAMKVHSMAEKRRRERINEHLSVLRRMIPEAASKMDKASLLGRVIDHVKDLKRKSVDISKRLSLPAEENDVVVEPIELEEHITSTSETSNIFYLRASICCEDRPDLFMSLVKTFHALRLRAVRAEITSLGGRVQIVFVLCGGDSVWMSSVKESVKDALVRIASFDMVAMDTAASSSKRQRLMRSYYSSAVSI